MVFFQLFRSFFRILVILDFYYSRKLEEEGDGEGVPSLKRLILSTRLDLDWQELL